MATRKSNTGRGRPSGSTAHSQISRLIDRGQQLCSNLLSGTVKQMPNQIDAIESIFEQMENWWTRTGQHMVLASGGGRRAMGRRGARAIGRTRTTAPQQRRTGTAG